MEKSASAVFSPAGSSLFLRANSALDRIITQRGSVKGTEDAGAAAESVVAGDVDEFTDERAGEGVGEAADESLGGAVDDLVDGPEDGTVGEQNSETVETSAETSQSTEPTQATAAPGPATESAEPAASAASAESADGTVSGEGDVKGEGAKGGSPKGPSPKGDPDGPTDGGTRQGRSAEVEEEPVPVLTAEEGDAVGKSVATRGHERAAGGPVPVVAAPAGSTGVGELTRVEPSGRVEPVVPSVGHFTVPTAVAVVPAAPRRRTAVEGGFDFFGMQKSAEALEAVQNEDLADVVGQEALALHKAESEAQFKRADEASRGIGQVIDLTAHDETEQIDVQGLRTAAS
ncbi:hypothetical protein E4N62_18025 [Streptomyces sp. MNU76]|uniref:hypothetical protein n=1 Tax=Streptomyces sp. MNU76 TaxID=2560026 RepID=UPI001E629FB8|nr:hypothetical protein [Streptomyces sp. MNU76]MCC9706999.1 hypothetical protein [Streptomyces sp. MNU76]